MKLFKLSIILIALLQTYLCFAKIQPSEVFEINKTLKMYSYKLPNGLSVYLTPNPNSPNVTVSHWVKAGSLHEKKGITGIAHLFEHMMFRPLEPNRPSFFDVVSKMGGQLNASTRFESTYYYSTVPTDKLSELLDVEANRFKNLRVTDDLLNIERKAVWSEYSTKFDSNPVIESWFNVYNKAYPNHPFEWMIIGYREDLDKISASDCNTFFQKYYRPNNIGLFVTGNFDREKAIEKIVNTYGDWQKGEEANLPPPFQEKTKFTVVEGKLESQSKNIIAGFRVPYYNKDNAAILTLLNYILYGDQNGLLKKQLVNSKHWASEVGSFNFSYDNGMLKTEIVTLPGTTIEMIKNGILELPKQFSELSDSQFNAYKTNLYISFNEGIEIKNDLADMAAMMWGKYSDIHLLKTFTNGPVNLTKKEVQDFLNQYFREDNLVMATTKGITK